MDGSTRKRHARVHLPALTAEQAWVVVDVLERVVKAIWNAHGPEMVAYEQRFSRTMPESLYPEGDPGHTETPF